jgi:hypothetical protein
MVSDDDSSSTALVLLSTFIYQCSGQYSSRVCTLTAPAGELYSVYTESRQIERGFRPRLIATDVCIVQAKVPPVALPEFDDVVTVDADDEESQLQKLTDDLRRVAEHGAGSSLPDFSIRWGVRARELPFLLEGPAQPVPLQTLRELLCLALEVSLSPSPGQCITRDRICVGCDFSVQRLKVAIFRIRKFFECAATGDALDAIVRRISKRFAEVSPGVALRTVSCCSHCFRLYSMASARSIALTKLPPPEERRYKGRALSANLTRQNEGPKKMKRFLAFQKTPSGLTVVQDVSAQSQRIANPLYLSDPFPPFLQHP